MNMRIHPQGLLQNPRSTGPAWRRRFHPRRDLLDEVAAGFLWMHLDLPDDIGRQDIEGFAHRLTNAIADGEDEIAITRKIASLQRGLLGRPVDANEIAMLARRLALAVKGA